MAERLSVHPNTVYQWEHGLRAISEDREARLAAVHAETPAAWAVLAHSTEAPATFPQGLMQERPYWERVAREIFPAAPPTVHVQAWAYSRAFSEAFPPRRPWRSSQTPA